MYYKIPASRPSGRRQFTQGTLENPSRHPAPSRVEQGHNPPLWCGEVDGDAVGDGDREQRPSIPGGVAVDAVEHEPSWAQVRVPRDVGTVHLVAQDDGGEPRLER